MQWFLSSRPVIYSREKGPVGTDQPTVAIKLCCIKNMLYSRNRKCFFSNVTK